MSDRSVGPRCAALVGPYLSGKTTLLEALLCASGTITRRGTQKDGNTVGDATPEARARQMTTEINVARAAYLNDDWTFLDCPGSVELAWEAQNALLAADVAVIVCEPEIERALTLAPLFKFLDDHQIPHMLFINKMDGATARVSEVMAALQGVSQRPLVLRQVPLQGGAAAGPVDAPQGYVDLVSERAYQYKPGQASDLIKLPDVFLDAEKITRAGMVEQLADFDDKLLEELLEDVQPSKAEIYHHLTQNLRRDLIVPVFLGAAQLDHGVRRLLKALRHETPEVAITAARLKLDPKSPDTVANVIKTYHPPSAGRLSLVRIWSGEVTEGMSLNGVRVAGVLRLLGAQTTKLSSARPGEVVGLARLEGIDTGTVLSSGTPPAFPDLPVPEPVYGMAIAAEKRSDDVKLTGAVARLIEEDPTLSLEHNADLQEMVLWGQGDIHLQIALDRLKQRYNLAVSVRQPQVPYKETIRKGTTLHSRFKRQSGGHGQFADIQIEVAPLPRGTGHAFKDAVVGGAIPRNYIPAVEEGVEDYLHRGPLGFPVVDVAVTLVTGQFHAVDSSDQAFKTVARQAMSEAMPKCDPVVLEPIHHVEIAVPNAFTSRVQRIVSARRGQILGFDAKEGWDGWDTVEVNMPAAELHDLIIELRSATLGIGTYQTHFDHLQELTGKLAEKVLQGRPGLAAE